jgi:hypothetical protein
VSFVEEEKNLIREDCLRDPILFLQTFLEKHFYLEIPWVHRGVVSILTGRSEFLLRYGQIGKLVRNFVHSYNDSVSRQIFHVVDRSGTELTQEELDRLDSDISGFSHPLQWTEVEKLGVEIQLDLGPFTLIMMPRGSSKTALAGFGIPLYSICYKLIRFLLYVSNAGPLAQGQIESVRKELSGNAALIEFFGDMKPRRSDEERWSKEKIETLSGIAMQYRGKGAAIRGVNHNNFRPDVILVDDPQDKDDVRSDSIREEDKRWAYSELTPAREMIRGGTMTVLGTYLGRGSLVDVWSRDPLWTTVKIGVKDSDGEYIWPQYWDEKKDSASRISYQRAGLLSSFYREFYNVEHLDEEQIFEQKFFIYASPEEVEDVRIAAIFADPATSKRRTADFFSISTVGITGKGTVVILDVWQKRVAQEEAIDEYFRQQKQWNTVLQGFESNAYQTVFGTLLRAEMFRRGQYFEITPVPHKNRKTDRIRAALRPRYAAGYVRHRLPFAEYEMQLLDFRMDDSHEHDDGPDSVAAALVLLDPAAAFNAGEDPSETHLPDIEDVIGEEAMDWCA